MVDSNQTPVVQFNWILLVNLQKTVTATVCIVVSMYKIKKRISTTRRHENLTDLGNILFHLPKKKYQKLKVVHTVCPNKF